MIICNVMHHFYCKADIYCKTDYNKADSSSFTNPLTTKKPDLEQQTGKPKAITLALLKYPSGSGWQIEACITLHMN